MGFIRFLLATSVLVGHSSSLRGIILMDPYEAVRFFFVISGFYMALVLDEKYKDCTGLFFRNRFMRIMPSYWVTVILTLISFIILKKTFYFTSLKETFFHLKEMNFGTLFFLLFSNIFLFGQDLIFFLGIDSNGQFYFMKTFQDAKVAGYHFLLAPQAWSISNELLFYFFSPWLVRRNTFLLFLIVLLSYFSAIPILQAGFGSDPWIYRNTICSFYYFILGIGSFRIYKFLKHLNLNSTYIGYTFLISVFLFIIFYSNVGFEIVKSSAPFLFCFMIPFIFKISKNSIIDKFMGEFSYPMYILHYLVIFWVGHGNGAIPVFLITLALSTAMIFLIERPILKFRER